MKTKSEKKRYQPPSLITEISKIPLPWYLDRSFKEEKNDSNLKSIKEAKHRLIENYQRPSSYENWSAQTGGASQGTPEQTAHDYEAEVFAQTGGAAARQRIVQESNKRIQELKQQGQSTDSKTTGPAQPNQFAGAVMVDFSVNKRSAFEGNTWHVRNPGYTCGFNSSGLVYLQIEVNTAGRVAEVQYIAAKSKNASACMVEQALKYAKLSRFSPGEGTAAGWISYRFEAQ